MHKRNFLIHISLRCREIALRYVMSIKITDRRQEWVMTTAFCGSVGFTG